MTGSKKVGPFKDRFRQACDDSPVVPEYGRGRQVSIAKRLKVTQEAVRKWFSGEAVPKPDKMRELAEYLEVDQAWLALGVTPEMGRDEQRKANRFASGAVQMVSGLILMEGGNVAWPGERDPRAKYVDLYAILRGTQIAMHVSAGREVSNGKYELIIPHEYQDVRCIGFIPAGVGRFHLLDLSTELIEEHKQRKGGGYAINVNRTGSEYHTGADQVPKFKAFGEIV